MKKPFIWGVLAGIALVLFYAGIMTLASGWQSAVDQFVQWWPWMTVLVLGFALQIGLYAHMREHAHRNATTGVAVSGGLSGTAMLACCTHHLADIVPFIGVTVLATFAITYQAFLFSIGIASSVIGVLFMLKTIQKHKLYAPHSLFATMKKYPMTLFFRASIVVMTGFVAFITLLTIGGNV